MAIKMNDTLKNMHSFKKLNNSGLTKDVQLDRKASWDSLVLML